MLWRAVIPTMPIGSEDVPILMRYLREGELMLDVDDIVLSMVGCFYYGCLVLVMGFNIDVQIVKGNAADSTEYLLEMADSYNYTLHQMTHEQFMELVLRMYAHAVNGWLSLFV